MEGDNKTMIERIVILLICILLGCKSPVENQQLRDLSGRWEGWIDGYPMLMILAQSNSSLSGQASWSIEDPSYGTNIDQQSYVFGDSVFINLTSINQNDLLFTLHGRVWGDTLRGDFLKRNQNAQLSPEGTWEVVKQ